MKVYYSILMMVLFFANGYGQTFPNIKFYGRGYSVGIMKENSNFLEVMRDENNENLTITGDTVKVIHWLLDMLQSRDSTINDKEELIEVGVMFLNNIPDFWKLKENNKAWQRYWNLLRKNGYNMRNKTK